MKPILIITLMFTWLCQVSWAAGGRYDFDFQDMGVKEAIESIAKMQNKNVIFSKSVVNKNINLKLEQVTPAAALRVLLKSQSLTSIRNGNILRIITYAERAPASRSTNTFLLKHVLAKDIINNVKTFLGDAGSVSLNSSMNALIINAKDALMGKIRAIISDLDQENRQVFIEAKVIEATTTFARDLGIEIGSPTGSGLALTAGGVLNTPASDVALVGATNFKIDKSQLEIRLTAGERNGDLKVLTSPRITTLNGKPAIIENTTTFNVRTLAPVSGGAADPGAVVAGGLQTVEAGVRLKVTPFIMSDSLVRLDIDISKSEPDFSNAIDDIPGIIDNSAQTALIVKNGQMVSIGGLISSSESFDTFGVPFLSGLPVIGILFGNSKWRDTETEILIFLTPTVFRSGERQPEGRTKTKQEQKNNRYR